MKMSNANRLVLGVSALAAALGAAGAAYAQSGEVGEVIVTAQKRAESLQSVPIAVTAITGSDLDNKQIVNLEDIRDLVPNLFMEQALTGTTTPKMFIRGVGVDNQVFSFDSPIGLYFDDVYIARVTGALVDLFDVQQVEFLRGPQGTLFGRNSSAGALRITTRLPNLQESEGSASFAYGTENQVNANVAFSAPLVEDKVGLRATFMSRRNDGFQTDQTGQRFMDNDITAFRGALLFAPSENVDVILRGDFMLDHSTPTQAVNFRLDQSGNARPALLMEGDGLFEFARTPSAINRNEVEPWGVSATVNARLTDLTLKSITAYRGLLYRNAGDVDGRIAAQSFEVQQQDLDETQFSQELFVTSDHIGGAPLQWTAGLYYMHEENDFTWALRVFSPPSTQFFSQDTDTIAAYAQGTYPVTERLNLTGGLRYTFEEKALTATQNLANGTPNAAFRFDDSIAVYRLNWRAAADFEVTEGVLLYASGGTGFRSGGFNGSARDVASILSGSFGPETVESYEFGAKTELFDRHVRFNIDYFTADYKGLQQAVTLADGTISTRNVSATVDGVEAEMTWVPTEELELTATLGTMNDEIENSTLQLKDTPSLQWRVGAIYTVPVGADGASLRFGADVSHTDSYYNGTNNEPNGLVAPYDIYNAQIAYTTSNGNWSFKLSGTNLGDHVFPTHTFDLAGGAVSSVHFPSNPRRVLFTIGYNY
ncbi:MAG: TonB-dependent receptor [Hyphomonadaceae bacterium]|nr:TonB-dependent receptor [Hyphomonadaceae bacterium]